MWINPERRFQIFLVAVCFIISFPLINQPKAGNITYTYDELNRLIQVTYEDETIVTYSYDKVGNRQALNVTGPQETITTPSISNGPTNGNIGVSYSYSTGGSVSNFGHPVQYFFDWGDGTNSDWFPVGTTIASKSWASAGIYNVKAQARCSNHTSMVSSWSTSLSVTITSQDATPPTPNPMTWAAAPYQTGTTSISMVATTANDPTSPINYFFDFVDSPTGGVGGTDSSWQPGASYINTGLSVNHQYGYQVKAKDGLSNETSYSTPTQYAYTAIETPTGIAFGIVTSTSIQSQSTITPSGLTRGSSGLIIENTINGTNSGWRQNNGFWTGSSLSSNTSYSFRAKARNGDAVETVYSSSASRYTLANAPGAASFSNVTQTCIRANWTANGNPGETQYFCENTSTGTNSGWTTNTYWNNCGLTCATSYSFRVRAKNGEGIETDWINLGSQSTIACVGITVVSPNEGENWKRGTTQTIRWSYTGNPGNNVKIELLKGGVLDRTITSKASIGSNGNGSYNWKIPKNQTPGTDYQIRVTSTNNPSYADTSDKCFTISQ